MDSLCNDGWSTHTVLIQKPDFLHDEALAFVFDDVAVVRERVEMDQPEIGGRWGGGLHVERQTVGGIRGGQRHTQWRYEGGGHGAKGVVLKGRRWREMRTVNYYLIR